eukprot:6197281-Pleurochrysis_carterae.AAC.1
MHVQALALTCGAAFASLLVAGGVGAQAACDARLIAHGPDGQDAAGGDGGRGTRDRRGARSEQGGRGARERACACLRARE